MYGIVYHKENKAGYDLVTSNPPTFQGGEVYYAIYYVTEFKYTGKGDVFTAPADGSYTFKLWGSPGGRATIGGGYTEVTMDLKRNEKIYSFVGSAGAAVTGNACAGGYNGGGFGVVCLAGSHSGSGGGASHISYVNNPIISDVIIRVLNGNRSHILNTSTTYSYNTVTLYRNGATVTDQWIRDQMKKDKYWGPYINNSTRIQKLGAEWYVIKCHTWNQTDQVIAVAGGAGGDSTQAVSYAGGDSAHPGAMDERESASVKVKLTNADNNANRGYARGTGMYVANGGGGGGGWWGGYSINQYIPNLMQTNGGHCGNYGGGGTSYIKSDGRITSSFMVPGNDPRLKAGGAYQKPATEGTNGYIKVYKN